MSKVLQYTVEFKDQAVRFLFDSIEPNESRKEACRRLAPQVNVKEVKLYNWVKAASPITATGGARAGQSGTVDELRAQLSALRKENHVPSTRFSNMFRFVSVTAILATGGCTSSPIADAPTTSNITNATVVGQPSVPSTVRGTQASDSTGVSTMPDPLAVPTLEGRFPIGTEPRELALTCWGEGAPVVLFDAGSGDAGISRWKSSPVTRALAAITQVCAYDRAGLGDSDPAPQHPRVLDEVADDLHFLLVAAGIPRPVVMVGSSGGGFDVYHHAGRYPNDVAGLVLLDVPAGQAAIAPSDVPGWDAVDNPEHMDYVAVEHQMAVERLAIPAIPVTVVTANHGQSADPDEQKVWLEGSSRPVQVILEGGHNIYDDDPDGVLKQIIAMLDAIALGQDG